MPRFHRPDGRINLPPAQRDVQRRCDEFNAAEREFVERLRPLASQLAAIRKQARALGLFVEDRELLACPHCGLHEDVAADGRLLTCRDGDAVADSGLRFKQVGGGKFRCPSCRRLVSVPAAKLVDNEPGNSGAERLPV